MGDIPEISNMCVLLQFNKKLSCILEYAECSRNLSNPFLKLSSDLNEEILAGRVFIAELL